MINTAAMVGLGNDPAYNQLKDINKSIQELFRLKTTDSKDESKHLAQEREKDKRAKQDADTIIGKQDANVAEFKTILKDPDMGIMGAIISAAGLAGALMVLNKIDVSKFVGGIWDGVKERLPDLKPGTTEDSPSTDAAPTGATKADGSPDMSEEEEGGAENLSQADPNFKGLPMPSGAAMTSPIGMRWGKPHNGLDVAAAEGTPLTVSKPGKIVQIGSEGPSKGYGNYIVYKDTMGEHIYAHLQKYGKYRVGQSVKPGDTIAYMGNTGRSFGAHLHWEFDKKSGVVGYPRPLSKTMDPTKNGYKWSSPLTGLQSGGAVGLPMTDFKKSVNIKNPISLPAMQKGGTMNMSADINPLTIINQITEQQGPNIMMKGAQPMSESGRSVKAPQKPKEQGFKLPKFKLPSFTYQMPRLKLQKGGEAMMDKGSTTRKYMKPGEQTFKQGGRRHMITDKLPVEPKQVDPVFRPKFEAKVKGQGPSEKMRTGGVVRLKRGGQAPSGLNVGTKFIAPMEAANELLKQHYTNQFFVRQARKKTGSQIIIVNKVVSGGGGQPPAPGGNYRSSRRDQTVEMPSYQDISTNFNRFISGIRV